jgi:hypothetical protein
LLVLEVLEVHHHHVMVVMVETVQYHQVVQPFFKLMGEEVVVKALMVLPTVEMVEHFQV